MAVEELNRQVLEVPSACRHGEDFRWDGAIGPGQSEQTRVTWRVGDVDDAGGLQCGPHVRGLAKVTHK